MILLAAFTLLLLLALLFQYDNARFWQHKAEREEKTAARYFALLNPEDEQP